MCKSKTSGNPDHLSAPCPELKEKYVVLENSAVEYLLTFPNPSKPGDSPLKSGENYGLCVEGDNLPEIKNEHGHKIEFFCKRFSVYRPLFSTTTFSTSAFSPTPSDSEESLDKPFESYLVPEGKNAVVFGVVDPNINEYVGTLNLQWENVDKYENLTPYKTAVAAQDPAEALREAMLAFDWKHQGFNGVRIVLAQMSPQKARILAQRLKRIDLVVSAADHEQASAGTTSTEWTPDPSDMLPNHPAFLAVPDPYFVPTRNPREVIQISSVAVSKPDCALCCWGVRI